MSVMNKYPAIAIQTQPRHSTHPYHFVDLDDLAVLLEENAQSTPGFEILADSNSFEIKQLHCKGDTWSSNLRYKIFGESKQALLIAIQDLQLNCFFINSIRISVFTDTYKDPVFLIMANYNARHKENCCKISTSAGLQIGSILKLCTATRACPGDECFIMRNDVEDLTFRVTGNSDGDYIQESDIFIYDIWSESTFMANITHGQGLLTIYTVGSLSCESKVTVLGLAFYLNGISRAGIFGV